MAFQPLLPPSVKRPKSQSRWPDKLRSFCHALRANLHISTWLLLGGSLQSLIVLISPRLSYALVLPFAILVWRFADTLLITFGHRKNPYLEEAIMHRVSPQIPDEDGNFSNEGANEKVAVLHLGAKINHPLGLFAPNVKQFGDYLGDMVKLLDKEAPDNGFLGGSVFSSFDKKSAQEIMFVSYWRSIDDIHQFAYSPLHREAWEWWSRMIKENNHLGINHEIFEADRGKWEAMYVNFQPTLLGATTYLRKGDKLIGGTVEDQWISPLIDARSGKLRSSAGRMGHQPEQLYEKYKYDAPPSTEAENEKRK